MIPNPTPPAPGNFGISAGASGCLLLCVGGTFVATPQGNYFVPEFGAGIGPSVSFDAGPKVTAPTGPSVALSGGYKAEVGPVGIGASGSISAPFNNDSLGNVTVGANVGISNAPSPLNNLNVGGTWSYNNGFNGGVGYGATGHLFEVTDQYKGVIKYPIPLPDISQTTPPDANGVSDVFTQTGTAGPPAITAVRTLPPGYPDGMGDTVTLNSDGSYTVHTSTGDVTTFGPNYLSQQGLDSNQGGTLTHQLIDTLGQRTDQWTWQGNDGNTITQTPSGTLTQTNGDGSTVQQSTSGVITQTNPDGSTVTYDPSTGTITTSDGHWFGTSTTFNQDGSVTQSSPSMTTTWDSSGQGMTTANTGDGIAFPMSTSEPAPTPPSVPPSISLPHNPNTPAPADTTPAPAPTDTTPAPAPTDTTTAPPPTDTTPAPAPAPIDAAPTPPPIDTTPAIDTPPPIDTTPVIDTPPPIDTTPVIDTPPPIDTTPVIDTPPPIDTTPVIDTPPPIDSGSIDSGGLSGGFDSGGGAGGDGGGD